MSNRRSGITTDIDFSRDGEQDWVTAAATLRAPLGLASDVAV